MFRFLRGGSAAAATAAALLAGCATTATGPDAGPTASATGRAVGSATPVAAGSPARPAPAAAAPAAGASAPASAAAPTPAPPGSPRPFADVVKDAKRSEGLIAVWQKDDKVWFELREADFGTLFVLSPKLKSGIGETRFFGGLMGEEVVVEFRRVHNQVQLLARNMDFAAKAGTPTGLAVEAAYSPSLLGSVAVASQPHPERKSVLIEANGLLLADLLGYGMFLQRTYRQGYALDARNSAITKVRTAPDLVVLEATNHYATSTIALPQPGIPPGAPVPSVPRTLPDARSLFLAIHYSIAKLPDQAMAARRTDPRIGYFAAGVADFSDDLARTPRQRYITRWRLDKKDPSAARSEPVKPIVFWLDRTVPQKYRGAITAGILEWNKAFERIGLKDAIRVEVQPDDAEWDTLDYGRASVRWMTNASPAFGAIGPSHVDPRSGEILDADIGIESLSSRNLRFLRSQVLGAPAAADAPDFGAQSLRGLRAATACIAAEAAAEQLFYAFDVFDARGDIDPQGPEAERMVGEYLRWVTMHEVGHTLGLRHNFRASRVYTDGEISDPAFAAANGIVGSVMEYPAINLPAPGVPFERAATTYSTTLGPYDYWAIEYGYKPLAPEQEAAELARVAARSAEPALAYGTDEDQSIGIDPEVLMFDLGSDPVAFARKRVAIARDLIARQEGRVLEPAQDYALLRRSVGFALRDLANSATVLARQVGGVRTLRDRPGSGRDPLVPLPVAAQRAALDVLMESFLAAESLRLSPALQRKLAIDFEDRTDAFFRGEGAGATDFSALGAVVELQRGVLNHLMSEAVAVRLLDSEAKAPNDALRLRELYERLDAAVWSELVQPPRRRGARVEIAVERRELQRDHVNRIAAALLRPSSLPRADFRGLLRSQAQALHARLAGAARSAAPGSATHAHLLDSADTLAQALAAKPVRSGA